VVLGGKDLRWLKLGTQASTPQPEASTSVVAAVNWLKKAVVLPKYLMI
jgi:hypothetical protein